MALTKGSWTVTTISSLANRVTGQATALKANFDKAGSDIKTYINNVLTVEIDALVATTETNANNYTDQVAANFVLGALSPNSVTNNMIATASKIGLLASLKTTEKSDIVSAINDIYQNGTDNPWGAL